MADEHDFELVIIGAGVIGLACATIGSKSVKSTLVIERHESFGFETSSRNSEVIHSGIYYPKNSLKTILCVKGNESIYEWCKAHKVPHRKTGKYIISTSAEEEILLEKIFSQGQENGARELSLVSKEELRISEPNIKATMAIYSPTSGIVDSHELMKSLQLTATANECEFAWRHSIVGVEKLSNGYKLIIEDPTKKQFSITATKVINAAGLESDTVADILGIDVEKQGYRLKYYKGSYFRIASIKKNLVNHLIYPVPPVNLNYLGIHLTIDLNGEIKIGPDSEQLEGRELDYKVDESLKDKFFNAVSRYLIGLEFDDIHPDMSGIRSSLYRGDSEFKDFIIQEESENGFENWINLIGIDSPGLTCCLEIAQMCTEELDLK